MAGAQTGRAFYSLEAYVGLSETVDVGRIVDISLLPDQPTLKPPLSYGKVYAVTTDVTETLKGERIRQRVFQLSLQGPQILQYFQSHRTQLLIMRSKGIARLGDISEFGLEDDRYQFRPLAPTGAEPEDTWGRQADINGDYGRYFDDRLRVVQGAKAVLDLARRSARKHPQVGSTVAIRIPNTFAAKVGYPNAYALLSLSKSTETEATLRKLIEHPEEVVDPAKHVGSERNWNLQMVREGALEALSDFKSRTNEAFLKGMADKPLGDAMRDRIRQVLDRWRDG